MTLVSSLTNRIFFASAALAVLSIAVAIYNVNVAVTTQAEQELRRGLDEAGTLVEEYRRLLFDHFSREARLVADLSKLKAAVELNDPPTVRPIAAEYQQQLGSDLLLVANPVGDFLAEITETSVGPLAPDALAAIRAAPRGRETGLFLPHAGGILQIVSVPIWIDPMQPQLLGTLSVGFTLDPRAAARFRALTNSEIAFGMDGRIQASTLPENLWPSLSPLLEKDGLTPRVWLAGNEYIGGTRRLAAGSSERVATAIILRSRTERLRFLTDLHRTLAVTALLAVLAATLLSYGIARTVTRPLGAVTAAMRDMAATGDLTRRIAPPAGSLWEDEDARLLATTFNSMTDSIGRFQREATQRERLSSLGRLSTVVAHEIRNPLMIIKTALRVLRREDSAPPEIRAAVADIDEEIVRLNRIVSEVLDFARPIKFDSGQVDVNALCEDAVRASAGDAQSAGVRMELDAGLQPIVTDGERLRQALVNILVNARHAVAARTGPPADGHDVSLSTYRAGGRVGVRVQDWGAGIAPEDLPRVFEPYFTTRRTGSGLGLAISRNIIEGLGGTIAISSRPGEGTDVRIELPVNRER
jgi:signal transduction histidine kinase